MFRNLFRVLVPLVVLLPGISQATNGYFTHGTSIKEKGLAGAGVAYSQDTLATANNPAGMVFQGAGYDVGAALFNPNRSYSVEGISAEDDEPIPFVPPPFSIGDGDQSVDSESEYFLIPQFGYNWILDDLSSIGVAVFGRGGLNTDYEDGTATLPNQQTGRMFEADGTFGAGNAGVDLSQLFVATTYARKFSKTASWGASLIVAYQRFEAKGLENFGNFGFSNDPDNLTNNGHDNATGIGLRLGVQGEVAPGLRLGAAYQPEIDMSEFDEYAGLFAEEGDFNIPSNYTLGLAWDVTDTGTLFVDLQQINYEDVPAVSNSIDPLFEDCLQGNSDGCLGGDDGAGFGWEDMTIVKIGYQWRASDEWTWRFGYSQGDQPIPEDEVLFNILAPGVMEQHFTFGFTKLLGGGELNFAAMVAPSNSVTGEEDRLDPASQEIELEMDQIELSLGYGRRF